MGLILNTRPAFYQERFHAVFGDLDWPIYDCPVTLAEPLAMSTPSPAGFDALIFTSQMGVVTFAPTKAWLSKKVYAVGQGTAETAIAMGFTDVVQTGLDVDDMRRHLRDANFKQALYPSADEISADLPAEFPGQIRREIIYRMIPRPDLPDHIVRQILAGTPIAAPVFSRRGTDILADLLRKAGITSDNSRIIAVGISANVFAGGQGPWQRQIVADEPIVGALVAKTSEAIGSLSS